MSPISSSFPVMSGSDLRHFTLGNRNNECDVKVDIVEHHFVEVKLKFLAGKLNSWYVRFILLKLTEGCTIEAQRYFQMFLNITFLQTVMLLYTQILCIIMSNISLLMIIGTISAKVVPASLCNNISRVNVLCN